MRDLYRLPAVTTRPRLDFGIKSRRLVLKSVSFGLGPELRCGNQVATGQVIVLISDRARTVWWIGVRTI